MAEVRNKHVQKHLEERECINSKNRQDTPPSPNHYPFHTCTKYNTWQFQLSIV